MIVHWVLPSKPKRNPKRSVKLKDSQKEHLHKGLLVVIQEKASHMQ